MNNFIIRGYLNRDGAFSPRLLKSGSEISGLDDIVINAISQMFRIYDTEDVVRFLKSREHWIYNECSDSIETLFYKILNDLMVSNSTKDGFSIKSLMSAIGAIQEHKEIGDYILDEGDDIEDYKKISLIIEKINVESEMAINNPEDLQIVGLANDNITNKVVASLLYFGLGIFALAFFVLFLFIGYDGSKP